MLSPDFDLERLVAGNLDGDSRLLKVQELRGNEACGGVVEVEANAVRAFDGAGGGDAVLDRVEGERAVLLDFADGPHARLIDRLEGDQALAVESVLTSPPFVKVTLPLTGTVFSPMSRAHFPVHSLPLRHIAAAVTLPRRPWCRKSAMSRVLSAIEVRNSGASVSERAVRRASILAGDRQAVVDLGEASDGVDVDVLFDEADAAIDQDEVAPGGVPASEAAVIDGLRGVVGVVDVLADRVEDVIGIDVIAAGKAANIVSVREAKDRAVFGGAESGGAADVLFADQERIAGAVLKSWRAG